MDSQRLIVPFTAEEGVKIRIYAQEVRCNRTDSDATREAYIEHCEKYDLPAEVYDDEQAEKVFAEKYVELCKIETDECLSRLLSALKNFSYSDHIKRKDLLLTEAVYEDDEFEGVNLGHLNDLEKRVYLLFASLVPRKPLKNPNQIELFSEEETTSRQIEQTADTKKQARFNYDILLIMVRRWAINILGFDIDENYCVWGYPNEFDMC